MLHTRARHSNRKTRGSLCSDILYSEQPERFSRDLSCEEAGENTMPKHASEVARPDDDRPKKIKFGLITDVQYAPHPMGYSYSGIPRYYREALSGLEFASEVFEEEECQFAINLGDLIDGKCGWIGSSSDPGSTAAIGDDIDANCDLDKRGALRHEKEMDDPLSHALAAMSKFTKKWYNICGNHELYCMSRDDMARRLGIPMFADEHCEGGEGEEGETLGDSTDVLVGNGCGVVELNGVNGNSSGSIDRSDGRNTPNEDLVGYSSVLVPSSPYKLIFLDNYDETILGRKEGSLKRAEAVKYLTENNAHNYNAGDINSPEGLRGSKRRFVAFNGGLGSKQLNWLKNELESCAASNTKAIIFSHQPVHPKTTPPICLPYNYSKLLSMLQSYASVVSLTVSGHCHANGYYRDEQRNIHYLALASQLESVPPQKTFAIVEASGCGEISIKGFGDIGDRKLNVEEVGKRTKRRRRK